MSLESIRVLHVIGSMGYGGIETWLMHMLRHIDRNAFHLDFCYTAPNPGDYAPEIRSLGLGAILVAAVWGGPILGILYRPDYATYHVLFVWLMVAAVMYYLGDVLGQGMTAARIFRPQVPLFAASSVGIFIVCWFGIERYGLIAAAWSLVTGGGIMAAGSAMILLRVLREAPGPPAGISV